MTIRLFATCYVLASICISSFAQAPSRYDIVIDEVLPDPLPAIGLPDAEFIELKNISSVTYNLHNWKIINGSNQSVIKIDFILQPDSFVIICSTNAASAYAIFGPTIPLPGFPSLANSSDIISLQSPEGITVHAVAYDKSWYQNDVKSNGGWSLEMIDTKNPCSGYTNWKASIGDKGGTPGKKNSVDNNNRDIQPPSLNRTYDIDSVTIMAVFDEPLDSTNAANIFNYQFDNNIGTATGALPIPPLFNEVQIQLSTKLRPDIVYALHVSNVPDCAGNSIGMVNTAKTGLPSIADSLDIVINEILFNPKTNGYDYVEFYNRGNKIIDLTKLYVGNRNITTTFSNITQLSSFPLLFFPGEYYVISENSLWLNQNYLVKNPDKVIELSSLPSLPDDHGDIVLLNQPGNIVDELEYDHKWHFALIDNEQGVALERIDYNKPTQDAGNWASAASTAGFGTPTYQNSEFKSDKQSKAEINIEPKIFSPDNDGYNDYCFINYEVPAPGYVANISIYDAAGRPVRYLVNNAILGLKGNFRWDGLDDKQKRLPIGIYIVCTEIFDLNGNSKKIKQVVTLARRF